MKVGIVGCGINGAYLAWKMSKDNDVEVFERNSVVGEKPCSELISERIWKFIPRKDSLVVNEIDHLVIHYPKRDVKLKFFPKMLVVDRKQIASYMIELAKKNGAKVNLGTEVSKVHYMKGAKPQISAGGKVREFDYLIGSDGYNSVVRKSLGIKDPKCILGIYTRVKKKPKSNTIEVYPLKNGICWVIPRQNEIEYGVYEKAGLANDEFKSFCKKMRIKPKEIYAQLIPNKLTKMQQGRIALSGDAIGLTKPWSYGGIIWGLTADDFLIRNFPNLSRYESSVRRYFEPKIFYSKAALFLSRQLAGRLSFLAPKEVWFDGDWFF